MPTLNEPKLIAGNANLPLAQTIARRMSMHRGVDQGLVDARVERFNDGEIFVEVYENVRGEDMFIIQPTSNPANMLTGAGIERVLTMDLHAAQIQGFFDIPVDNLYASPIFALDVKNQFKNSMDELMVVSPDVGGVARARELAKRINAPLSIVDKRREKAGEVAEMTVIGDVKDKICLIIDDMCDTAGTLCKAAQVLLDNGAKEVHAYITHGVMSGPAVERVTNSVMKSLVLTDSIQPTEAVAAAPNIRILPTAPLFTQAILNIWHGTSVSSLFEDKTLVPIYESLTSNGG